MTTGLRPLTVNSVEQFKASPRKDQVPWNVTGGAVFALITDPNGVTSTYPATITPDGYAAYVNWRVPQPVGTWLRAWDITDASGIRQVSQPIEFVVIGSPVSPFLPETILIQDSFREIPGNPLAGHIADTGQVWPSDSQGFAFFFCSVGLIYPPFGTGDIPGLDAGTPNYTASVTFSFLGDNSHPTDLGVAFRMDPNAGFTGNFWTWALDLNFGGLALVRFVTGVPTQVGLIPFIPNLYSDYTVGVNTSSGGGIHCSLNGAIIFQATDGYLAGNTIAGLDGCILNGNTTDTFLFKNFLVTTP